VTPPETLPDDIGALQSALLAERAARQQAEARASGPRRWSPISSRSWTGPRALHHHLCEISSQVAADAHAMVILDGASWHNSHGLVVPSNITLLALPAYSPELNPVAARPDSL